MSAVDVSNQLSAGLLSFYCPLTAEVSPDAHRLYEHTLAWARRFDLGAGNEHRTVMFASAGSAFTAHACPHARGELAQALSDYFAWAWVPNALVESGQPVCDLVLRLGRWERIMRSPDSWPDGTDDLDRALRDACSRLRRLMTAVQWQRFAAANGSWLYHMGWEASLAERGHELSVNDYLAVRLGSGGGYAAVGYIDAVEGIELSEQQWARPIVRAAAEAAACCAVIDNDRYSSLRERDLAVQKRNLFDALRLEHPEYTAEQAVTAAVALRDRVMALYLALRKLILLDADADLERYITGLDRGLTGNVTFCIATTRYLLKDSPQPVTLVDQPSTPSVEPLTYPTIAWWWEQLTP